MNASKPLLPISGSILECEIRNLLKRLQYAPVLIAETIAFVERAGTAAGCGALDPEDADAVNALVVRHTGTREYESAEDFPAWTDADRWTLTAAEPYEPEAEDAAWVAAGGLEGLDLFRETEDESALAALAFASSLTDPSVSAADLVKVRVRAGARGTPLSHRNAVAGPVTDEDMARVGALG